MKLQFWNNWKRKTKLEIAAINSVKSAKEIILTNIPKEEIISIYVKGSFVRRELNKKSDVDIVPILKSYKYLKKLRTLEEKNKNQYTPRIDFRGYSISQLITGKKLKNSSSTPPSKIALYLDEYALIYGKPIDKSILYQRTIRKELSGLVNTFNKIFLPDFEENKFAFQSIIKQIFWLTNLEQKIKGENPPTSWKKLDKFVKNKDHIIHDAYKLRLKPTKDKKQRKNIITKLKKYLKELERLTK